MTEEDKIPIHSPLSQPVSRDGKTVRVEIYEDGYGGWLLEVVDEFWNSTVWESVFASDTEALDQAMKTIDEDGIDSLIGAPSASGAVMDIDRPIPEAEFDELDDFLSDEAIQDTSMDVSTLDGFLAAIAIGPSFVPPSEWLPWVFDMDEGEAEPDFESEEHASRIMSLLMRHYNSVVRTFSADPTSFEPIFWRGDQWGAAEWCEGFILGCTFDEEPWGLLATEQPTWFTPFLRLGTDDGIELTKNAGDGEKWMNEIGPSLMRIHAHWKEYRRQQPEAVTTDYHYGEPEQVVRGGPKIGRNDPCPCGSGKKFKRCCGADGTPSSVH